MVGNLQKKRKLDMKSASNQHNYNMEISLRNITYRDSQTQLTSFNLLINASRDFFLVFCLAPLVPKDPKSLSL